MKVIIIIVYRSEVLPIQMCKKVSFAIRGGSVPEKFRPANLTFRYDISLVIFPVFWSANSQKEAYNGITNNEGCLYVTKYNA